LSGPVLHKQAHNLCAAIHAALCSRRNTSKIYLNGSRPFYRTAHMKRISVLHQAHVRIDQKLLANPIRWPVLPTVLLAAPLLPFEYVLLTSQVLDQYLVSSPN
jgi:hypothetical protein